MTRNVSIIYAVKLYFDTFEIGTSEIAYLFNVSKTTAVTYKREAQAYQIENGVRFWDKRKVNTRLAFEAWGLDIRDLQMRCYELLKLEEQLKSSKERVQLNGLKGR